MHDFEEDEFESSGSYPRGTHEFSEDEFEPEEGYQFDEDEFEPEEPEGSSSRKINKKMAIGVALVAVLGVILFAVFGGKLGGSTVPGKEIRAQYDAVSEKDWKARHMVVLKHVADRNMPSTWDDFVPIEVKGPKGTVVEFYVAKHPLRLGMDDDWVEIPVDGPSAAAICELTGYSLPHYWMIDHIHVKAREEGGAVHFYTAPEIAQALKVRPPRGSTSKKEFILKRNELIQAWMKQKGVGSDQLQSGHYKDVVLPVDGSTSGPQRRTWRDKVTGRTRVKSGRVEIYGGYFDNGSRVQPLSGGHHVKGFFDYPQGIRFVKKEVKVNGETIPLAEFVGSREYGAEFGFQISTIQEPYYPLTDELKKFVEEHK